MKGQSPAKPVSKPASLRINANALPLDGSMAGHLVRTEKKQAAEKAKEQRELERKRRASEPRNSARPFGDFRPFDEFPAFPMLKEFMKDGDDSPLAAMDRYIDYYEEPEIRESDSAKKTPQPIAEQKRSERKTEKKAPQLIKVQKRSDGKTEEELPPGEISEAEARQILIKDAMERRDQEALRAIPLENTRELHDRWERYRERLEREARPPVRPVCPVRAGPSAETRKKLRAKRKKKT